MWRSAVIAMKKGITLVIVQSRVTGPVSSAAIVHKVSRVNTKFNCTLADGRTVGHGRGRCKEPLKEEGQDENSKPDVKPTTASAIDTGGQDSDFERKPVVVVGDPSW